MNFPAVHVFLRAVLVIASILAAVIIYYLARSKNVDATQFRSSLKEMLLILWRMWCWVYIIPWRMWYRLRHTLAQALLVIITLVSFFIVIEGTLVLLHHREITRYVPWLSNTALAKLPDLPLWADLSGLGFAILLSLHHIGEWKAGRRKEALPQALENLVRSFGQPEKQIASLDEAEIDTLFQTLIVDFRKVLELQRKMKVSASLMVEKPLGKLTVRFMHHADSQCKFNKDLCLDCGQGGAGLAYTGPRSIYIPSVSHLVGIDAETVIPAGLWVRKEPPETFRSVLCIPVIGKSKVLGVLVFASGERNAFGPADYQIMRLAAVFVSFFF